MQDELRGALFELDDLRLDDARHGVPARAHTHAVQHIPAVNERDRPGQVATLVSKNVQLFTQGVERDLQVLDDRVRLDLVVEGLLPCSGHVVLGQVVQLTDGGGLARVDELLALSGDERGLHELAGHAQIEELPGLLGRPHLDDGFFRVKTHVGQGPCRNLQPRTLLHAAVLTTISASFRSCRRWLLPWARTSPPGQVSRCQAPQPWMYLSSFWPLTNSRRFGITHPGSRESLPALAATPAGSARRRGRRSGRRGSCRRYAPGRSGGTRSA